MADRIKVSVNNYLHYLGIMLLLALKEQAMTSEPEASKDGDSAADRPGRTWTVRCTGAVRYRRFCDEDGGGRPSIILKFELPAGQTELPKQVYDVLHSMKFLDRSQGHGRGKQPTHLEFKRDTKHGRVWRLPDTPTGRMAADIIDARLADLAKLLDNEQGKVR